MSIDRSLDPLEYSEFRKQAEWEKRVRAYMAEHDIQLYRDAELELLKGSLLPYINKSKRHIGLP